MPKVAELNKAEEIQKFLSPSLYIDSDHPLIVQKANELVNPNDVMLTAKTCFEFVRDEIAHSGDTCRNPVTCKASDVLIHGTGFCYAKSHLLAALLRANQIPAGLCYQRLSLNKDIDSFCLHGLNALYLHDFGWFRVDPRGNKAGIDTQFQPPLESLAFSANEKGETTSTQIFSEPLTIVTEALTKSETLEDLYRQLPDFPHL